MRVWQGRAESGVTRFGWSCRQCKADRSGKLMRLRGMCGSEPFDPSVPDGVTLESSTPWGVVDGSTFVPLHSIIPPSAPPALKAGLVHSTLSETLDGAGVERLRKMRGMPDREWSDLRFTACPLAAVSEGCPSPAYAPALESALEALSFGNVAPSWVPPRSETTDPVRTLAITIRAAQQDAQSWKSGRESERDAW